MAIFRTRCEAPLHCAEAIKANQRSNTFSLYQSKDVSLFIFKQCQMVHNLIQDYFDQRTLSLSIYKCQTIINSFISILTSNVKHGILHPRIVFSMSADTLTHPQDDLCDILTHIHQLLDIQERYVARHSHRHQSIRIGTTIDQCHVLKTGPATKKCHLLYLRHIIGLHDMVILRFMNNTLQSYDKEDGSTHRSDYVWFDILKRILCFSCSASHAESRIIEDR
ncbi:uncharacterized protein MELLADRAFT_66084 [Melampsora larici-populina 98AG31]|uniref:Uncharacterized protein n=1 Tax=Melampsora larici-populina (strain 98AG31 / pathotype 3-4-7) TaxID=747676 RepID=F4RXT6_MELLP|nr:uncharacterized protein MELLADRAFT_66084 [Melampsora larici-populina 98AG31]EGG02842.1 hypothetical protein MELLADRAFT_66084 [Melampsora larici-populina 98AG31]